VLTIPGFYDVALRDVGLLVAAVRHERPLAQHHLTPKGVGVVIEAEHLCMSLRGVRAAGARTVTSALQGLLRDGARSRQEFFALTGVHG
jgi:GTP cyclohydrolase I